MESAPHPSLDTLSTIRDDGSRRFVYTADVRGRFTTARRYSAVVLIAVYLLLPWIRINGFPAVFLDMDNRRFHLFGLTLAPQDAWLMFFLITGLGFSLFFLTALFGRIWCGWACPQTIFLDHLFRRIERWTEGDAIARRRLRDAPWSVGKFARRVAKHGLYAVSAALITHLFLAYFVSLPRLWGMMRAAPGQHVGSFLFVAVATGILYFDFAWFREQLCIVICPYGRLQSALLDDHSLIIGYDGSRGEPRGGEGDCVDCLRCVRVCPTGIDIRNGSQLECIGCAACIDACDDVMAKLHRPKGLVRYDSLAGFAGGRTRWLRPRTALYAVLLLAGAGAASWGISTFRPATLGVTRMIGAPYYVDGSAVRDQFFVRIINKRTEPVSFYVDLKGVPADVRQVGLTGPIEIPPLGEVINPLVLEQPISSFNGSFPFSVSLRDASGPLRLERSMEFLGPDVRTLRDSGAAAP